MTGRGATMSLDGTLISQSDMNRMAEEERLFSDRQRKTVRVVAGAAENVHDARMLLDMLGLSIEVVRAARQEPVVARPAGRRRSAAA